MTTTKTQSQASWKSKISNHILLRLKYLAFYLALFFPIIAEKQLCRHGRNTCSCCKQVCSVDNTSDFESVSVLQWPRQSAPALFNLITDVALQRRSFNNNLAEASLRVAAQYFELSNNEWSQHH